MVSYSDTRIVLVPSTVHLSELVYSSGNSTVRSLVGAKESNEVKKKTEECI